MKKVVAVGLSVVLVVFLTGAALGRVPWLWFYVVAAVAGLYAWHQKQPKKE